MLKIAKPAANEVQVLNNRASWSQNGGSSRYFVNLVTDTVGGAAIGYYAAYCHYCRILFMSPSAVKTLPVIVSNRCISVERRIIWL